MRCNLSLFLFWKKGIRFSAGVVDCEVRRRGSPDYVRFLGKYWFSPGFVPSLDG